MNNKQRKLNDNINNQIRYYKKKYGYDISIDEYYEFKKNINIIKKVFLFHDYIISTNQFKIPYEKVEFYGKNYDTLKLGFSIKPFLSKLKKVNPNSENISNKSENKSKIIVIEF